MIRARGLDWPGLMRAGMQGLGLRPDQFWRLTPAELALMLGVDAGSPAMTRGRLAELAARYPDPKREDYHMKGAVEDGKQGRAGSA
ncbi:rcc01693 family protein [Paracoccus sp. (in: a-proteobacteria)]|uniref:rcc01693 family protein n=1 Tax=Paracoccus sp. TaxID=267 RepID=UPI003A8B1387